MSAENHVKRFNYSDEKIPYELFLYEFIPPGNRLLHRLGSIMIWGRIICSREDRDVFIIKKATVFLCRNKVMYMYVPNILYIMQKMLL